MMFPTSMFPAAVRRTLSCAGLALAATLFPACGGGGAGGAGAPDNEGPASRLVLEGYETDRLLSRRGDIPLQYRGEVPADLTIRAWLDEDGDVATTDDRFGLLDNLPHPTDGRRLVFADAVFFQDISFHLLLTAGDPADGIYSMSRGRVRFANTAFARAIGEMDVSRMIVRTAVTPNGRIVTSGNHNETAWLDFPRTPAWGLERGETLQPAWLAMHAADGQPQWVRRQLGSTLPTDVITQSDGTIYQSFFALGIVQVEDGRGGVIPVGREEDLAAFLLSYAPDGTLNWVRRIMANGGGDVFITPLIARRGDANGIYVAASADAGIALNVGEPDARDLVPQGGMTAFVAGIDADGRLREVERHDGADDVLIDSVAARPDGGVVVGVRVQGTLRWQSAFAPNVTRILDSTDGSWDAGYIRLDANLHMVGGRVVASDGDEVFKRTQVAVHGDDRVDLVTQVRPVTDYVLRENLVDTPRVRGGAWAMLWVRYADDDVPLHGLTIAPDAAQFPADIRDAMVVARPDGRSAMQLDLNGAYVIGPNRQVFAAGARIFTLIIDENGFPATIRQDGGTDIIFVRDLDALPDGGLLATHSWFGNAPLYGKGDDGETVVAGVAGNILVRMNADGGF